MPLPFQKDNFSVSEPVKTVLREPDNEQPETDLLSAVAKDLLIAVRTQDEKLMREVLGALLEAAREQDVEQDKEPTEE